MLSLSCKIQRGFLGVRAPWYLGITALILLTGMLAGHPIWTQEYRWQNICAHMLSHHDYLHPYLDGHPYYDKPLLSYWLIIACAKLTGGLNLVALRLPSIMAAGLTLYSVFYIGRHWFDRATGLLAAWLLLSTFYFIFWGRVASTDMLNISAITATCAWLLACETQLSTFKSQSVLLLLLVIGALLKGLIAPALSVLIMLPWLAQAKRYRAFLQWRSILWGLLALALYLSPFLASSLFNHQAYQENGLSLVFQENILRFFKPFDHQGGVQTYLIYAPLYLLPWTPLWLLALAHDLAHLRKAHTGVQWLSWAVVATFVLLTLSGSRRSYYILPLLPFAALQMAAYWQHALAHRKHWQNRLLLTLSLMLILLFGYFVIIQPWYYACH